VGAVTVANINDSNGNGIPDKDDSPVANEKDLMKLKLAGFGGLDGKVRLTLSNSNIKLWNTDLKSSIVSLTGVNTLDIPIPIGNPLDLTFWVEATTASTSLRDIVITMSYIDNSNTIYPNLDQLKATAIWVDKTDMKNSSSQSLWSDVQSPMNINFNNVGHFGHNRANGVGILNVIGFQFTIFPPDAGSIPQVKFDIGRQIEGQEWNVINNTVTPNGAAYGPLSSNDIATDDGAQTDESLNPVNNHLYSYDSPGTAFQTIQTSSSGDTITQVIIRKNFNEFVRVSFDGNVPSGNTLAGSRCSHKVPWQMALWVWKSGTNTIYQNRPGKPLTITTGHTPITPTPTP
jgi:hypothetical protein